MKIHDHAGDVTPPSAAEQVAGTMFDLSRLPAGSYAVDTSQDAADALNGSGELARARFAVLAYIARRPSTAPQIIAAWGCDSNRVAPRMTELRKNYGLIERTGVKIAGAHVHRLTATGWRVYQEQQARTHTADGSFGPERKTAE